MKKYLITGCAGFIGSNFVHYMLKKYPVHSKLSAQDLSEEHPVASNFGKKSKQVTFVPEASA